MSINKIKISDFFNNEFKEFSSYDNVRSIPSVIDGLKDAQRKAVYGMIMHGGTEIKVSQAMGKFALATDYDHGEVSMGDTIIGLAQNHTGTNNLNLFEPIGQFGSILSNNAASPRYIFTKPSKHLREVISTADDCVLEYKYSDGQRCEPVNFYPILPLWLINGAVGIGTGHSVKILQRDVSKVRNCIRTLLRGNNITETPLQPHINGFTGEIKSLGNNRYEVKGKLEKINTTTIKITELPFEYSLDRYKGILVRLMDNGEVRDYDNNSTEKQFEFIVKVPRSVGSLSEEDLYKKFRLVTTITENITLWNKDGVLTNYNSVVEPLKEFVEKRLEVYELRRIKQIEILTEQIDKLKNKMKFILEWNRIKDVGKLTLAKIRSIMPDKGIEEKYLDEFLTSRVSALSLDEIKRLEKQIENREKEKAFLENTTNVEMYMNEL